MLRGVRDGLDGDFVYVVSRREWKEFYRVLLCSIWAGYKRTVVGRVGERAGASLPCFQIQCNGMDG